MNYLDFLFNLYSEGFDLQTPSVRFWRAEWGASQRQPGGSPYEIFAIWAVVGSSLLAFLSRNCLFLLELKSFRVLGSSCFDISPSLPPFCFSQSLSSTQ